MTPADDHSEDSRQRFTRAIEADDHEAVAELLGARPSEALDLLNETPGWAAPLLARARSVRMAQRLLDHGAILGRVGEWWAPGFNVVGRVDPTVGTWLIDAGATATPHAAAGVGHTEALRSMIRQDPDVVHAKGGDGCTPLHFARTIEIANMLLDNGADIDARDDDHDSTPVQWLIREVPEVVRHLLTRGATPDLFLAAALGERDLAMRLIDDDPACLAYRVGLEPQFPAIGYRGLGGTIYQWTLGFNSFAHQYALAAGHRDLHDEMLERSDLKTRFLVACLTADRPTAQRIVETHPDLMASLPPDDLELLARYSWETNVNLDVVRLMVDLGWPLDVPEHSHAYMPLHNAAFGGYADVVDLLIEAGAPVDARDPTHDCTPLGFAIHCCCEDGRHPEGEYTRVVQSLIRAGCPWDRSIYPTGHPKIDAGLRPFVDGA